MKIKIEADFDPSEGPLDEGRVLDNLMFEGLQNIELTTED